MLGFVPQPNLRERSPPLWRRAWRLPHGYRFAQPILRSTPPGCFARVGYERWRWAQRRWQCRKLNIGLIENLSTLSLYEPVTAQPARFSP
ncbi:hypothetical protein D9M72_579160 [compost metagenome]